MNLAEMLCYADIDQLNHIAQNYACEGGRHSKHELIQAIMAVVNRRESLEERVSAMDEDELRFLNALLFEKRATFSLEELKARAIGTAAIGKITDLAMAGVPAAMTEAGAPEAANLNANQTHAARQAIARFKHYGWLFNGFSHHTKHLYQVPEDVKRTLREVLEIKYRSHLVLRDEPPVYRDEKGLLLSDLHVFLRYVRDHEVLLAADGVIYKRQLQQILALMSVPEQVPEKTDGWRFGYGRRFPDYPDRLSFLYDYAYRASLVVEQDGRLLASERGRWAAEDETRPHLSEFYSFWLRLYRGPIPNVAVLAQWVIRLCDNWTTVNSLYDAMRPLIRPFFYDLELDILQRRVLKMMMHLGLVYAGISAMGEDVVKAAAAASAVVS